MPTVHLLAIGSRGDVQPLAVLGGRLVAEGVDARVVALEEYASVARDLGAGFVGIPGRLSDALARGRAVETLARTSLGQLLLLRRWVAGLADPLAATLDETVRPVDTIVTGVLGRGVAATLAEARGCHASTVVHTAQPPTLHRESHFFGHWFSGWKPYDDWGVRFNWRVSASAGEGLTHALRRRLGLPRWGMRAVSDHADRHPVVVAASPVLVPPAPDWEPHVHQTGWLAPPDEPFTPDQGLAAFLERRPVHVGVGSLTAFTSEREFALVVEASRRSGVPVLTPAIAGVSPGPVADGVHAHAPVPHSWLFPRTAGVIHHGGAGTTHAGLRAGVPSVAVPWGVDQPYHGHRLHALGVGPAPIRLPKLDAVGLTNLLRALTGPDAPGYTARAQHLAERLRAEDGAGEAIATLGRLGHLG